jgi:ATP-dependent DNA helicase PIF1
MARTKKPQLSDEQKDTLDKVVNQRKSIFFTGCAGVGKSLLINSIVEGLRAKLGNNGQVAITASTGRAAFNIGGSTLHSFAGIGLGGESAEKLAQKVAFNNSSRHRWTKVKALIIDEISMIDGRLFDKLEYIARTVRKNDSPFGGIQLILTGDFLQLPPVSPSSTGENRDALRAFQADSWSRCVQEYICLRTVFRQNDREFIVALAKIRLGCIDEDTTKLLTTLTRELSPQDEGEPVNLYATKARADMYNNGRLEKLSGETYTYTADDIVQNKASSNILKQCPAPDIVELKKDAQVMLIRNLNSDLVNGTVGIITGFTEPVDRTYDQRIYKESLPIVRFTLANGRVYTKILDRSTWEVRHADGSLLASRCQMPLILAWAVTIHKSQGQTIQRLRVYLGEVFESGQVYVALSRAVNADNLQIVDLNPSSVRTDALSLKFWLRYC